MERLTSRCVHDKQHLGEINIEDEYPCGNYCTQYGECRSDCDCITAAIHKLAEYEDLEEQGRLIKLPCRIGDELFYMGPDCDEYSCDGYSSFCNLYCEKPKIPKVRSFIVKQFRIKRNSIQMLNHDSLYESYEIRFDVDEIGKTVFFTREEAEKALQERKKENG